VRLSLKIRCWAYQRERNYQGFYISWSFGGFYSFSIVSISTLTNSFLVPKLTYSGLTSSYWLAAHQCHSSHQVNNFDYVTLLGIFNTQAGESQDDQYPGKIGIESFRVFTMQLSKSSQELNALGRKDILITNLKASSFISLFWSCFWLSRRYGRLFLAFFFYLKFLLCSYCRLSFRSASNDVLSFDFFFRIYFHFFRNFLTRRLLLSFSLSFLVSLFSCCCLLLLLFDISRFHLRWFFLTFFY